MATSRTGTAKWKRVLRLALAQAQAAGQTYCPLCRRRLDWTRSKTPASPEGDHIIEYANGGTDTLDNVRIICRLCNQKRGGKLGKQRQTQAKRKPLPQFTGALNTSQDW